MTLLRCSKFILIFAGWSKADDNAALSSLLSSLQKAQGAAASTAGGGEEGGSSLTASDLINSKDQTVNSEKDSSASGAAAANPLLSLLSAGNIGALANLADPSALTNSIGSLTSLSGLTALPNVTTLTGSLGNLADLTSLTSSLGNLGALTGSTSLLGTQGLDVGALTSGMDIGALSQGLNMSHLLQQAGELSNTFGELSALASTANTLIGSIAGDSAVAKPAQELLSMAGAVSGIGSSVAGLVNTTNTLTDLSNVMDTGKLLQEVSGAASNPLSILTSGLGGNTASSTSSSATATSVPASLVKAFITNGYLNQAGQSAMRLSGIANEAYKYQDLANVLSGAAPAVDSNGELTLAVQRALADMGINVKKPEELITYAINRGLNTARRLTAEHPTFREAILNFNNALGAAVKSQVQIKDEDKANARMLQGIMPNMGGYGYNPLPGNIIQGMQGMPLQAIPVNPPPPMQGMPSQGMGMYPPPQFGGYLSGMSQMPRYGNQMYGGSNEPISRGQPHTFMSFDSDTVYDAPYVSELDRSGLQSPRGSHTRPMPIPSDMNQMSDLPAAMGSHSQMNSPHISPMGGSHGHMGSASQMGSQPYANSQAYASSQQYPTRPEYQLLEQIASQSADGEVVTPELPSRIPARRLQSWINDTLGALVSILDEERPEWKTDVQNAANELATQLDSLSESLRSGDLPDKLQSLWQQVSARAAEISQKGKHEADRRRLQEIYFQQVGLPFVSSLAPFMSLASPFLSTLQSPLQASPFQLPGMSPFGALGAGGLGSGGLGAGGLGASGLGFRRRLSTDGQTLSNGAQLRTASTEDTAASAPTRLETLLLSSHDAEKEESVQAASPASDIMSMLGSLPGTTDITAALSSLMNAQGSSGGLANPLAGLTGATTNPLGSSATLTNPLSALTSQAASLSQTLGSAAGGNTLDVNSLLSGLGGGGNVDTTSLLNALTKAATNSNTGGIDLSKLIPNMSTLDLTSALSGLLPSASNNDDLASALSKAIPSASSGNDLASSLSNALANGVGSLTQSQTQSGSSLLSGQGVDLSSLAGNLDVSALTAQLNNLLPHQRRLQAAGWPYNPMTAYPYGGLLTPPEYPGYGLYPLSAYWAAPYNMQAPGLSLGGLLQQSLGQMGTSSDSSTNRDAAAKDVQSATAGKPTFLTGAVGPDAGLVRGNTAGDVQMMLMDVPGLPGTPRMESVSRPGFRGDGTFDNDHHRRQDMRMDEHRRQEMRGEGIRGDEHRRQEMRGEGLRGGDHGRLDGRTEQQRRHHDRYLRRLEAAEHDVSAEAINERLRAQSAKTANQSKGTIPAADVTDSQAIASAVNVLSQAADSESTAGVNLQEFLNILRSDDSTMADIAAAVNKGLPTGLSLTDLAEVSKKLGLTIDPVVTSALDAASLGTNASETTTSGLGPLSGLLKPLESLGKGTSLDTLISAFGSVLSGGSSSANHSPSNEEVNATPQKALTSADDKSSTLNTTLNTTQVTGVSSATSSAGTLDLTSLLGSLGGAAQLPANTTSTTGTLDLSGMLGSLGGGAAQLPGVTSSTMDLGELLGSLSGGSTANSTGALDLGGMLGSLGGVAQLPGSANATSTLDLNSLLGSLNTTTSSTGGSAAQGLGGIATNLNINDLLGLGTANGLASLVTGYPGAANTLTGSNSLLDPTQNLTATALNISQLLGLPSGSMMTMDIPASLRPAINLTTAVNTVTPLAGASFQGGNAVNVQPLNGTSILGLSAPTLSPALAALGIAPASLNLAKSNLPSAAPTIGTLDLSNIGTFDLSSLANFDWSKLANLDLSNLGTLDLGELGNIDLSKLDLSKLANIDFSKLGNIDLSKLDLGAISSMLSSIDTSSSGSHASSNPTPHEGNHASASDSITTSSANKLAAAHRMLGILSDADRADLVKVLEAPVLRQSMASLIEKNLFSDSLKSELHSLLKSQVRSLLPVNTYGLTNDEFTKMQGLLGSDTSTWLDALNRIKARGVDLRDVKVAFDANGVPSVGKQGVDLAALKAQLENDMSKETLSATVPLASLASGLAGSRVDLNALVHNVTNASLDINGLLRIMDVTGVDVNNLVRGLESAQASDPAVLKEILEGATGQGINYQALSQAVNLLESINPMLGLSSLASNADIKHAMQVLNLTDISPLIGTNPLALFQPKLPGVPRRLSEVVDEIKAKAGAVEAMKLLGPTISAQKALSHSNQQGMLLEASDLPAKKSVILAPYDEGHRKLESMSPPTAIPISTLQANLKAQPVDVRFDQSIKFVSANTEGKFVASTGDLGFNWNFDEESSMIPPTIACWSVNGQAETADSWPSVIVQSAALDIISKETGSVVRTLDLSRPDSENVFEYYSPGWNITQAWLKKRNDSCAWIPMCYLMDQLAQLKSQGPLSASLSILVDRVPPSMQLEIQDARVVVRSVASQGIWEQTSADASLIPIGTVLSPPVAQIGKVFKNTPVFGFELPKPSDSMAVQGSAVTGYAVLASAESTGLTFVFDEVSWSWIPESAHPAYARILDQLKTFDDKFQNEGDDTSDEVGSDDDDDDYEASAIAMFNAKRDLPIKVNEWTYIPKFVLETVAYTPERNYIVQKCLPLTGMSSTMDPLASTIFEMLYNNGGALETSILMKTFMEAAPIQAMVSSQEGISVFDMRNTLIDDYSLATWRVNVSLSKIYPTLRGQAEVTPLSGAPCSLGECDLWQL